MVKRDINAFRERFNRWKNGEQVYDKGRPITDDEYASIMEKVAIENNPKWNKIRQEEGGNILSEDQELVRILNDNTYDYRGYYNKYPNSRANADTHWTDEFKTAYHPTFSTYSKYSGKKSQYNPEGVLGGHWDGEKYIPAWGQKLPSHYKTYSNGKDADTITAPVLSVKAGDTVNTEQCAEWANKWLRDNGYITYGNAWNLKNVDVLYNGYKGMKKPAEYDRKAIEKYNHAAADSVYKNFDSTTLDKSKPYSVNMFYNGSPVQERAYEQGDNVTGTHTGLLTFNPSQNKWYVTHNIHGTIHQDLFVPLQSGKGKYGVTAIYEPRENTTVNKIKGFFGFEDGKDSGIYIKPSHRGRLTALKKRTSKSEAELYRTGGPDVRKMITFARNARKWHHN